MVKTYRFSIARWEFKTIPHKPKGKTTLKALTTRQSKELGINSIWANLSELNGMKNKNK